MKHLVVIVGPTAIGKTAMSIQLAQHYDCEILSCDSRQFYREMTIGTAVPSNEELTAAKHHFIHNRSVTENYTVGDFEKEAITKLEELYAEKDFAILVGGSGLYVDAVLKGFDDFPEITTEIRDLVSNNYKQHGLTYLQEQLQEKDPAYFHKLTVENPQTLLNPQRMMRFVEVCLGTDQPYSSFLNQKKNTRSFTPIVIGLEAERSVMYDRINQRVDLMMADGLQAEVKKLISYKNLNSLQTVGYKELFDCIDEKISLPFAVEEIKKNTRRFAKRQLTWFKRNENTKWFDFQTDPNEISHFIDSLIKK
jgi:tRNA dimethylallyltransferase